MNLPEQFVRNVRGIDPEAGQRWLDDLPVLLEETCRRWDLTPGEPFPLSYNYVLAVTRAGGAPAVLKLGLPNPELTSEMEALRLWNGCGAARLLESDPPRGLLLLERLIPGQRLRDLSDDRRAAEIAAELMLQLWREPPAEHHLLSLHRWFDGLSRYRVKFSQGGPLPERLVAAAEALLPELFADPDPVVLHGDLHHENILSHGRGWRVIDPKGVIGPRGYEPAPFLVNPWPDLLARPDARAQTARRLGIFGERLGLERSLLLGWAVAHAALSAWWNLDELGERWEYPAACGEMFLEMLDSRS